MRNYRRLEVESLEKKCLLAAITNVSLDNAAIKIEGGDFDTAVEVSQQGRNYVAQVSDTARFSTSYENLNGDGTDATDFNIGVAPFNALHEGGAAGTRGFRPGYNTAAFAWITSGVSTITFATPSHAEVAARDIVELGTLIPGFENVVGTVTLVGVDGDTVDIDVTDNGDPQAGNWDVIVSRDYFEDGITQIIVDNRDANGVPTGVTNLDDLTFTATIEQEFTFRKRGVRAINADMGSGDDYFSNNTRLRSVVFGGDGDDLIFGGRGRDIIFGGDGDDLIDGGDGDDFLFGGDGDDVLRGGRGRDFMVGGDGADLMDGGKGKDFLFVDALDTIFKDKKDLVFYF